MGDMPVNAGDWETGQRIYANANLSRDYASWRFAPVLDARLAQGPENVAAFTWRGEDAPVRPILIISEVACNGCHPR